MSTQAKQKAKDEPFTYSWYLPVSGGKAPDQAQSPEMEAEPEPEPVDEAIAEQEPFVALPLHRVVSLSSTSRGAFESRLSISPSLLRIAGLSGWSVTSGIGMIALVVTQSPVPMTHVLALGGVWGAVSTLIWFLPSRLMK